MEKRKVGIIGCGNISHKYIETLHTVFNNTEVYALTDQNLENARIRQQGFQIPVICSTNEELLSMPEIEIVVILTNPVSHYEVVRSSLQAGKHTYVEKPLALTREEGRELLDLAKKNRVMLCAAPDSILEIGRAHV